MLLVVFLSCFVSSVLCIAIKKKEKKESCYAVSSRLSRSISLAVYFFFSAEYTIGGWALNALFY